MTATVRLNDELSEKLETLSEVLHKRKSDIIREAISLYAESVEKSKRSRIQRAVAKVKEADAKLYRDFEESIDDGL